VTTTTNSGGAPANGNGGFFPNAVQGIGGFFAGSDERRIFQSDHKFDQFISPVSSPFLSQDPRALTQIKPVFIWETTPNSNSGFHGGSLGYFGIEASVALTERLSLVLNKLGWVWIDPHSPEGEFQRRSGFAEIWLGPQYTFIRNDCSNTLLAGGITFQIPAGSSRVFQDTGTLTVSPYLSFAQAFPKLAWGTFHFMNTTGYALATDNQRTDYFYSNFHLDLDIANLHMFYPLIELNWVQYTRNGGARDLNFEGKDMINFGSRHVAGHGDLSLALGIRVKPLPSCEWLQFGAAAEWSLVNPHTNLSDFRLTFDVIFRY